MTEHTLNEVFEAVQDLATHVDQRFDRVDLRFEQLEKSWEERFSELRKDIAIQFKGVYRRIDAAEDNLGKRIVAVEDNLGKRIDLVNERIDKLYTAVDGFVVLHKKLDQEFTALQSKYNRLEERIRILEAKFAAV